ncbi:MFS transporter [Bacillus massilinigeriensis]|uniref:MFS transporter n=1 Tax=Bacillus massilionigeriensis TaxID=1805475 RepID=UPI00096B154C|nr:MFS transporter [Bacillus massilionigeriensis]
MKLKMLHPNVKIRLFDVFINSLSSSMYLPFLSIYFASRFGTELTGILMIITVIFSFCAGLYASYFSDLLGRKKILLGAAIARTLGLVLMVISNTPILHSASITFFAVLIVTASGGITEPVAEAMVIDVTTNKNRKSVYSLMYWFTNLSIVFGTMAGGFLFSTHLLIVLFISFILSIVSIFLILFFITDTYKPTRERVVDSRWAILKDIGLQYKHVSMDKTFMIFSFATLLFFTLEYQISNYVGIRLAKELPHQSLINFGSFNLNIDGTSMLGILTAENTILVVTTTLIIGRLITRFNSLSVLVFGLLIYTGGTFVLGFSNGPILLLIAGFIATIGEIMFWPIRQTYLADLIPENARSSYMAVNSLVGRGGSIIASLFITIGAFVTPMVISFLYVVIGLMCIWLFVVSIHKINFTKEST